MPAAHPIIGMNLSSSQTELVQSWGLGHSGLQQQPFILWEISHCCKKILTVFLVAKSLGFFSSKVKIQKNQQNL
jgi:hypothetical protein